MKMESPSKELLSAILNKKVTKIVMELERDYNPCLYLSIEDNKEEKFLFLNFYELEYLCKVWARRYDCELYSGIDDADKSICYVVESDMTTEEAVETDNYENSVIIACQNLLDKIKDENNVYEY